MFSTNDSPLFMHDSQLRHSELIYSGAILELYRNTLELTQGITVEREVVHHLPAVAILPVTDEEVLLVKQFRPAINETIYEIPAGMLDQGPEESALSAAQRELEEETGYQAKSWQSLGRFFISPGFVDEWMELYLAQGLTEVDDPLPQDDDEFVEMHRFNRKEIQTMIGKGEIKDLKTLYALQIWLSGSTFHKGE